MADLKTPLNVDRLRGASDEDLAKAGLSKKTQEKLRSSDAGAIPGGSRSGSGKSIDGGFTKSVESTPITGGSGGGKRIVTAMDNNRDLEADIESERTTQGVVEMQMAAEQAQSAQVSAPPSSQPAFDINNAMIVSDGQERSPDVVPVDVVVEQDIAPPPPQPDAASRDLDRDVAQNNAGRLMKEGARNINNATLGAIDPRFKVRSEEELRQELAAQQAETQQMMWEEAQKIAPEYGISPEEVMFALENNYSYDEMASKKADQLLEGVKPQLHGIYNANARQNDFETRLAQYEAKVNDLANRKIDPNRYVNSLAGWQKAMLAIGAAMSGFASRGGPNPVLNLLMSNIDNDIKAQQSAIDAEYRALGQKGDLLKLSLKFANQGGPDTAKAMAGLSAIGERKAMVMQLMQNPTQEKRLAPLMAQLNQAEAQYMQVLRKSVTDGTEVPDYVINQHPNPDALREKGLLTASQNEKFVPGFGLASDKVQKAEFIKSINEAQPAIEGAKRVLEMSRKGSRLSPEDRNRISTEMTALVGQLRLPFTGPGVLTDTEYDRLRTAIGDPNKLFTLPAWERTKLEQVIKKLEADINTKARNAGLPVKSASSFKSFKAE